VSGPAPTFAQQRIVLVAILSGVVAYAAVVAFVLPGDARPNPAGVPVLDEVSICAGIGLAVAALLARRALTASAANAAPGERANRQFLARLVPLAMLEGGCMLGLTAWMVNGDPVPGAIVAAVLFALALLLVPFQDPDAGAA